MQQRSIEEYIKEMMRMRERSTLPQQEQYLPKEDFPPVIKLGFETPSDIENDTEKKDFSVRDSDGKEEQQPPKAVEVFAPQTMIPTEPAAETPSESDAARERFDSPEQIEQRIVEDEKFEEREAPVRGESGLSGTGKLVVNVTTGSGLFPVAGANVVISDTAEAGGAEIAAVTTDISGKTPTVYLPAPAKSMSLKPSENGSDPDIRARYTVTVMSPGYVTTVVEGVSVFDKVTSIQKVDMLTESASDGSSAPRVITEDTVYRL